MKKVVVGMSGGVDSFVTVLMLQQAGYEVVGVTLELWGENDTSGVEQLCRKLGIPWVLREAKSLFREKVVKPFVEGYLSGRTPSPCCLCNSRIKWEQLKQVADELQIEYIATGHYVRILMLNGKYYIRKGVDPCKDQSYFLWGMPQEILARAVTPLGEYTKAEVKAWAIEHGYEQIAQKKESMGICFLQGRDYRDFIRQYTGKSDRQGVILDKSGQTMGIHPGVLHYTIGQKRGTPLIGTEPGYVAAIDSVSNTITVDIKSALYTKTLLVKEVVAADPEDLLSGNITVKVRGIGLNPEGYIKVKELPDKSLMLSLSEPAWAIASGQPVAFYRGDLLIGGGIAERLKMENKEFDDKRQPSSFPLSGRTSLENENG